MARALPAVYQEDRAIRVIGASLVLAVTGIGATTTTTGDHPGELLTKMAQGQSEVEVLRQTVKHQQRIIGRWHRYARKVEIRLGRAQRQLRSTAGTGSVSSALTLASIVYGVPRSQLVAVGMCESHLDPYASNGIYRGIFQEGPMFERGPFGRLSVWDPFANVFTAAYTVSREGWRQWECRP